MKTTNILECPECHSTDIEDSGSRFGDVQDYIPGKPINMPEHPIYECKECNERFIFKK